MPEAPTVSESTFIERLLQQTAPSATQPRRGQNYNYALRWYLKPDGTVVQLQGDPQNRAYYQDKGFYMLSDLPGREGKSEVQHYLQEEYPKILQRQREKAAIITSIRRAGERYRDLNLEDTFDEYTIEELREYLAEIKRDTGKDIRVILPRRQRVREEEADAKLLAGVESSDQQSLEGLQSALERGRERTLQGTGYDPIDQARRTSARRPAGATA